MIISFNPFIRSNTCVKLKFELFPPAVLANYIIDVNFNACHPILFSLSPTIAITTDINRFSKRFTIAKHVQYCCRKLAFSIGIASSFTIGPLDSINRASSHLRRSDVPFVFLPRSSRLTDRAVVVCLCRFRWPGHHRSPVRPSSKLPSLFRPSRVNSVGESGPASVSCCGVAGGCEIFQDSMRVYERETEWRNREREDRSKRDVGGGGWNDADWRERRERRSPESRVRKVGWMRWLRHGGAREQEIGAALL